MQHRESYVEMNDDGFDDDDFTSGIGNVNHIGGDDECHQLWRKYVWLKCGS